MPLAVLLGHNRNHFGLYYIASHLQIHDFLYLAGTGNTCVSLMVFGLGSSMQDRLYNPIKQISWPYVDKQIVLSSHSQFEDDLLSTSLLSELLTLLFQYFTFIS